MQDGDTFEYKGAKFRVEISYDDCGEAPWDRSDGHGVVTGWQRRDYVDPPRGFWRLNVDRHSERLYNWYETMAIAKRDGWGLCPEEIAKLGARLKREPTKRDIRKEAVRRDFAFLEGWCSDDWNYVVIGVEQVGGDGDKQYLGGVESNAGDYIRECAEDLAHELLGPINAAKDACIMELGG